jgi:ABC-2 type transport system ATP-binding protein
MQLKACHISKVIKDRLVLDDISLTLESGNIYGLVGRNGSGKTMLFRALSGLIHTNRGEVMLDNKTLGTDFSVLPSMGIVLENVSLYPELTGYDNLKYLASFKGLANHEDIILSIKRVGLDPADKRIYKKYSLGMKQRLAIAQAIMEKPDVIMLDEPTNGLDSDGVELIRSLILEEKARGALVLLASHNQYDIQHLSDHVYTIDHGRIINENV